MIEGDKSEAALNHHLKDFGGGSAAADQSSAPIDTYKSECPIINIAKFENPSPAGEARPTLIAHVVPSTSRPGELSLRLYPRDQTWRGFLDALEDAGFEPGDVVRIEAVRS